MQRDDVCVITVIVTTFNHERFIEDCIRSILAQETEYPFELIVTDDRSTDSTVDRLETLVSEAGLRVAVIVAEQNRNDNSLLLEAVGISEGRYIANLDGDDYWTDPGKLQKQVSFLEANREFAGCSHDTFAVDDRTGRTMFVNGPGDAVLDRCMMVRGNLVSSCSVIVRREAYDNLQSDFVQCVYGDWPLYFAALRLGPIRNFGEIMGVWRHHDGGVYTSLSTVERDMQDLEFLETIDKTIIDECSAIWVEKCDELRSSIVRQLRESPDKEEWNQRDRARSVALAPLRSDGLSALRRRLVQRTVYHAFVPTRLRTSLRRAVGPWRSAHAE